MAVFLSCRSLGSVSTGESSCRCSRDVSLKPCLPRPWRPGQVWPSGGSKGIDAVRVLVVEDEPAVRDSLLRVLRFEGYDVLEARDGQHALAVLRQGGVDVVVLDIMMPVMGGLEACRRLRAAGDRTPVLMLTARDAVGDRVAGLDAGADDYLPKPFALEELLARVRALLWRAWTDDAESTGVLMFGGLRLDAATRQVSREELELDLTRTEFALLECFLRRPGQVLTRAVLFEQVWGHDLSGSSNTLDVYVGYRKLEAGGRGRIVHTVRGVGFVLREQS